MIAEQSCWYDMAGTNYEISLPPKGRGFTHGPALSDFPPRLNEKLNPPRIRWLAVFQPATFEVLLECAGEFMVGLAGYGFCTA